MDKTADGATAWGGADTQPTDRESVDQVGGMAGGDPLSGVPSQDVATDTGDFTAPHTETWQNGEGDSLGQQEPVTSEVFQTTVSSVKDWAMEKEADAMEGVTADHPSAAGFPDHDPTRVDLEAPLTEEVGARTETWGNDDFHTTEPVTTQDGNEVGGPIGNTLSSTEVTAAISEAKSRLFLAMRVARAEIGMGIISPDKEFERIAELEDTESAQLEAKLDAYSKVRTARVATAPKRTSRVGRMPSMQRAAATKATSIADDPEVGDAIGW